MVEEKGEYPEDSNKRQIPSKRVTEVQVSLNRWWQLKPRKAEGKLRSASKRI